MATKIFAALADDAHQGWIWSDFLSNGHRPIVKIRNGASGKIVYCEHLRLDSSYIRRYNKAATFHKINKPSEAIVMNAWYRSKLGFHPQEEIWSMTTECADNSWGKFRACIDHPQTVVRVSAWLGVASVFLGMLGLLLGAISLIPSFGLIIHSG